MNIHNVDVHEDIEEILFLLEHINENDFEVLQKKYALFYHQLFEDYQNYKASFSLLLALQTLPKELHFNDFFKSDKKVLFFLPKNRISNALKLRNKIKGQLLKIKFILDHENK